MTLERGSIVEFPASRIKSLREVLECCVQPTALSDELARRNLKSHLPKRLKPHKAELHSALQNAGAVSYVRCSNCGPDRFHCPLFLSEKGNL